MADEKWEILMKQTIIRCDICPGGTGMELVERLSNHKVRGKSYRRRRFQCPVCDYHKTIFASGEGDEKIWPEKGVEDAKLIAWKETRNREL